MEDNSKHVDGERDHVSIEIRREDEALTSSIKERMEDISTSRCICKVPNNLLNDNENAYWPNKISIGPFHHGKQPLKPMEDHKWRYLHSFLSRTNPNYLQRTLEKCVTALRDLEHRSRLCYAEKINISSDDFVQMMLVDGCFIIELFLKYSFKSLRRRGDPLFSIEGMLFDLRCNLILIENQIPLFVLQRLFNLVPVPKQCNLSFTELAFRFFRNMLQGHLQAVLHDKFSKEGNHLLDLIYHSFLPTTYTRQLPMEAGSAQNRLQCATKLQQKGIKIKKAHTAESLLDIKLSNGNLEIPPLKIHRYTESLLRNLIAYEQCYKESTHYVTSYAVLMHKLVLSRKDSKLMWKLRVVSSFEGKEDLGISGMFEKLCEGVSVKDFHYEALCEQVNGFKRSNIVWSGLWQKLHRKPRGPVSVVLLVVAIALLLLTFVGTFFTVLSFSIHH